MALLGSQLRTLDQHLANVKSDIQGHGCSRRAKHGLR